MNHSILSRNKRGSLSMTFYREINYALLRATLGVVFLFYGVGKFMVGLSNFAAGMEKRMAGKLPSTLLMPFSYTLPFAEVIIGTLLVLGLFTRSALLLAGVLMIALTLGVVLIPEPATVANNVMLALVVFVLQWLAENNQYSLDQLRHRRVGS